MRRLAQDTARLAVLPPAIVAVATAQRDAASSAAAVEAALTGDLVAGNPILREKLKLLDDRIGELEDRVPTNA